MSKYRKKPVVIEAVQWTGDADVVQEMTGMTELIASGKLLFNFIIDDARGQVEIETPEGTMIASPGDWIIRGIKGEFYPCKPDVFGATYEPTDIPDLGFEFSALTAREYAAIHLRVPDSGDERINKMIERARRDDFAKAAMSGSSDLTDWVSKSGLAQKELAEYLRSVADSMLKEVADGE